MRIMTPVFAASLACVAATYPAIALDKLITVTGEATTTIAPDIVTIRLGVSSQSKTARQASEANAKAMTAVIAAIRDTGIPERDVQTARLLLQPQFEQKQNESPHLTGFRAGNEVTVKLSQIEKLADLIDRAVAAGANEISGIEFSVSDHSKKLDGARAEAVADARRKAEIYAKAAGVVVGRAAAIAETSISSPPRPAASLRAVATPIAPGELALHAEVTVSYELTQ